MSTRSWYVMPRKTMATVPCSTRQCDESPLFSTSGAMPGVRCTPTELFRRLDASRSTREGSR